MGEWTPIYISLIIILVMGIIVPFAVNLVVDVETEEIEGPASGIIDLIENGVDIFTYNLNPFNFIDSELKFSLINWIRGFGYLPVWLQYFSLLLVNIGFFYTFIKLLPTT